jgi:hypothetical protein
MHACGAFWSTDSWPAWLSRACSYFGHPGSCCDRANYTIHRSTDEGATFEFVGVIYPAGAGYSDVHVLPWDGPGDRLGVAFQRCLNDSSREGGGYNMAWASMTILP